MQNVTVQSILGTNNIYDFAGVTGVTSVTSLNGAEVGAGAGDVTVGFANLANGTQVIASGSGTAIDSLVGFTMLNGGTTPLSVGFAGGVNGTTIANGEASTATSATISSSGGVNGTTALGVAAANVVDFNAGATINALTVNAASNLRVTLTAGDFAAAGMNLTVAGAATNVNLGTAGTYKTINASGLTSGGVTVNASSTLTSFIGGAGNDSLTGNALIAATATINGGTGTDTVAATLVNAGNGARFTNFEVLSLTGATGGAFDVSILSNTVLTGVSAGDIGGGLVLSNLVMNSSGFNSTITASSEGDAITYGFASASVTGTTDAVNFNFNNATAGATTVDAGTITIGNVEIANFSSGGIAGSLNEIVLTASALQTVNITGSQAFEFTAGAQAQLGSALTSALTSINGSTATGDLIIVDGGVAATINAAGITITGGSGNDTITVVTSARGSLDGTAANQFGADTVTTGGGTDIVNVGGATARSITSAAFTTITDIAVGDTIATTFVLNAFNSVAVDVSAATSLSDALGIAATAGEDDIGYFVFAGNTFVVFDDSTAGFGTGDVVVRLTGIVDLSNSTLTAGDDLLIG